MSEPPLVSAVVAARNAEATIAECVRSLLAQSYPRLEIVVVDNGSSDRTRTLLAAFEPAIEVVVEATRGAGAARNAGVRRARGDLVAFTDSDCVADPDWLAELAWPLEDPSIGVCGGTILARRPANAAELFGEAIHDHAAAILVHTPPYAVTMSWMSRKAVLEEVGGFDERLLRGQDAELAYRIVAAGYRLAYCPAAIVWHRNERTARGLFREGWQHGFHGGRIVRLHGGFVERAKAESPEAATSRSGRRAHPVGYRLAFQSGKRAGRVCGRYWSVLRPLD